jgi:hypothetical protein
MRGGAQLAPEDGVARFNMLRPGYYRVAAAVNLVDLDEVALKTYGAASPQFEVRPGAAVAPITLELDAEMMYIQTFQTSNTARQNGDTIVTLYNSVSGDYLVEWNTAVYDTIPLVRPKPKGTPTTYWVRVRPVSATYYGEYALWVGDQKQPEPAPGTFANAGVAGTPGADGVKGGLTTTRTATSQLIGVNDKIVYGDMVAANRVNGDYYRFVME